MILYGAPYPAPNPRRVRIFLAEKGIDLPETPVDLMTRQHKSEEFRAKNTLGQIPTLELDDGTCISETVAICRYFDETQPDPPLFGTTPVEKALVDMWVRRVEFAVMTPVGNYWRHAHPRTAALLTQFKDFGESNAETYKGAQRFLDRELAGRTPPSISPSGSACPWSRNTNTWPPGMDGPRGVPPRAPRPRRQAPR